MQLIKSKEREKNNELVRKHFFVQDLGDLLEKIKESKNNKEKHNIGVNLINSRLRDLKKEMENTSKEKPPQKSK